MHGTDATTKERTMDTTAKTFTDHMDPTEIKIISTLLDRILAKGHFIKVYDGEEDATGWTRDLDVIRPEIAATDETYILIGNANGPTKVDRIGSIFLVHGNIEDVISDVSAPTDEMLDYVDAFTHLIYVE
jgi:hypothetical protein